MIKKIFPIILLTFVNVIGFTLLIPVLPQIAATYLPTEELQAIAFGGLTSAYALFQFLAAPILGSLSDKYGRKPLLLISQTGTMLSWVIMGAAWFIDPSLKAGGATGVSIAFLVIIFARVVDGVTGGNISVAQAWVSDATKAENRTAAFGILGATFGVGFLFGPALGGLSYATEYTFLGTSVLAFAISLFTLIVMYFFLPESLPEEKRDKELNIEFWKEINIFQQIKPFAKNTLIINLLTSRVFFALVFASYTTIIILLLEQEFVLGEVGLGLLLTLIGVYSIINQGLLVNRIANSLGELKAVFLSITLIFIGLVIIPFIPTTIGGSQVPSLIIFMVNAYILNLGISVGQPTFKTIFTKSVDDTKQGKIIGLDESLLSLGQAITPIIAGSMYAAFGVGTFFIFALILAIPNIVIFQNLRKGLHF